MDQILVSLELARESILRSLRLEQAVSEPWLWASLGCCLLLLIYLSVWWVFRKRRQRGSLSVDSSPLQEGAEEIEPSSSQDPVATRPVRTPGAETALQAEPWPTPVVERPEETLLERLRGRLTKTQDQLVGRLDRVFLRSGSTDGDLIEDLEEVLLTADLGVRTSYDLLNEVQKEFDRKSMGPVELRAALRQRIGSMLDVPAPVLGPGQVKPYVIMVVGVNGVGKTTSIGKLASYLKGGDRKVMLVAADTFRAAAIEQLEIWSGRVGTDFVKHKPESDPSAVVYDAMQAAKSRDTDLVIVDTAGRLHTKANLMEELKKVKRIMSRELEGAPHEVLLVVDATTGQNAINQARTFHEALGVTGIVLTKLDGTAKGGVIVGIANELQLPVRFIGIGEGLEDLRAFDPELFLEAIFGEPEKGWVH
jgi:fused signal recognition particle receptor